MTAPLAIVAAGARTPLGLGALATALALRAGKTGLAGAPFAGAARDQIVAGVIPTMAWSLSASDRAASLARGALRECFGALPAAFASGRIAVLLTTSVEGDTEGAEKEGALAVRGMLQVELGAAGRLGAVEIVREGETSVGDALARASSLLEAREADVVLWGGAHSDIAPAPLRALAAADRLFDADHLDAVVPGESAAVVALALSARAAGAALAVVAGVGGATTASTPSNEHPVDGDAMTAAVREAMANGGTAAPAGWVLSDTGYEALRLREWEMVQVRVRALLGVPYRWDTLPQRFGRAGAAHLPLAVALAATSFDVGHVPSTSVLATAGTDQGRRSAVWIRAGTAAHTEEG